MDTKNLIMQDIPETIKCAIQKIINDKDLITFKVVTKNVSTGGNNFLGELYDIVIEGKTVEGETVKMPLFFKHIIKNDDFKIYSISEVYEKEAFFYLELCRIYQNLQDAVNVPPTDRFNIVQSYPETNSECIILKNLAKEGYQTMPRMEVMSLEFAELSVSQLAKFHALSFVLQTKDPVYYESKIKTLNQSMVYGEHWNDFINKVYKISVSKLDNALKCRLDKFFQNSLDRYPKYMNGVMSTLKCLCHGDYKMNNILFKIENSKVISVSTIDYQQMYYGCPIIDLIYFLYAASDYSFRESNMKHLKDLYYDTLVYFLKYFDIDFVTICSKQEFDTTFFNSLEYALMYTLYMLPMFYVVDEAPSAKDDIMELSLNVDDRFHQRMKEIVEEFINMKVI